MISPEGFVGGLAGPSQVMEQSHTTMIAGGEIEQASMTAQYLLGDLAWEGV